MSRDKPWLKMWTEWLGDVNMDMMSLAEQGSWWRLYAYAHECGHQTEKGRKLVFDGGLIVAGRPLSLAEIMKRLKITDELDRAIFNQMVDKMLSVDYLKWNGDTLYVTHYENEQRASTDTKEARRQRQADWRRVQQEKREAEKRTPPQDTEGEEEERGERKEQHAQPRHENSVTHAQETENGNAKAVTQELSRCYENYIGLLNPTDADRMKEFTEYYVSHGGQIDWLEDGFKKAPVNKRRWPYVQAILERYIEQGGPDERTGKEHERGEGGGEPAAEQGAPAYQRDPLEATKRGGWKVKRSTDSTDD